MIHVSLWVNIWRGVRLYIYCTHKRLYTLYVVSSVSAIYWATRHRFRENPHVCNEIIKKAWIYQWHAIMKVIIYSTHIWCVKDMLCFCIWRFSVINSVCKSCINPATGTSCTHWQLQDNVCFFTVTLHVVYLIVFLVEYLIFILGMFCFAAHNLSKKQTPFVPKIVRNKVSICT